jgi:hypothetical protein
MMPTARSHAITVKMTAYLLGRESRYDERYDAALQISRAEDPHSLNDLKAVEQAPGQSQFM